MDSNSSAGQSLAWAGMVFAERSSSSAKAWPPTFPSSSPLHNPQANAEKLKSQLFFLIKEDIALRWCLGNINGLLGSQYCMAEQVLGPNKVRKLHCSIEKHAKKHNGSSKFSALADTFYINGGSSSGGPVAKKNP